MGIEKVVNEDLQDVCDHSKRPTVHLGIVGLSVHNLWSCVPECTRRGCHRLIARHCSNPKVCDDDSGVLLLFAEEHVLGLEIPVDDANAVEVAHGVEELDHHVSGAFF